MTMDANDMEMGPTNDFGNTNRILSGLDKKLNGRQISNTSSTYSNQTQQSLQSQQSQQSHMSQESQGSSVVVDKLMSDISQHNLQSNVLLYIKENQQEFSPNDLFQERQQRMVTRLNNRYTGDTPRRKLHPIEYQLPIINKRTSRNYESKDDSDEEYGGDSDENDAIGIDTDLSIDDTSLQFGGGKHLPDEISQEHAEGSIFFGDDEDMVGEDDPYKFDDDDEDDDMLIPPSPPRSPPRELDPDKLYGLYDFSGPDPLHCSISRDEPVFLINDQDNYWWLIRKLKKEEKMAMKHESILSLGEDITGDESYDLLSDDEDGKIGFVPAECLETHGERLARLNCFKNEELEKSREFSEISASSDEIAHVNTETDNSSNTLGSPVHLQKGSEPTLSRLGSILKDGSKQLINKSVTFEDLGIVSIDEESEDEKSLAKEDFIGDLNFDIPRYDDHDNEKPASEVLSDTFPSEMPLTINKRKSNSGSPLKELNDLPEHESSNLSIDDHEMEKSQLNDVRNNSDDNENNQSQDKNDNRLNNESETEKEGSVDNKETPLLLNHENKESPETPASEYQTPNPIPTGHFDDKTYSANSDDDQDFKTPNTPSTKYGEERFLQSPNVDDNNSTSNSERLRRSVILDKLNQVTSDIQQELDMEEYDPYFDQSRILLDFNDSRDSLATGSKGLKFDDDDDDDDHHSIEQGLSGDREIGQPSNSGPIINTPIVDLTQNNSDEGDINYSDVMDDPELADNEVINSTPVIGTRSDQGPLDLESSFDNETPKLVDESSIRFNDDDSDHFADESSLRFQYDDKNTMTKQHHNNDTRDERLSEESDTEYDFSKTNSSTTRLGNNNGSKDYSINDVTPLTSLNSLSNGNIFIPQSSTSVADKRKSKPVHDMFTPLLGKFDELSEKLAEIDGLL